MKVTVEINNDCDAAWIPDTALCTHWIEAVLNLLDNQGDSSVSLSFVNADKSAELNSHYRGKNSATNVLSFPCEYPAGLGELIGTLPLGDVVICPAVVEQEAQAQNKKLLDHCAHLLIHGVLHLLGHDHQEEAAATQMENLETQALQALGIANPY